MADIRYVIVSDLHFGAENSVLTTLNERPATATETGFSVDPQRSSPALSGLVDGLRELTRGQGRPPTLILAGDVLDLALSLDEVCAMVFRLFAHLAFSDGSPVFEPVIHYVPGNHDHHQWEVARESQYAGYVSGQPGTADLVGPLAHHEAAVLRRTARGQLGAADRPDPEPAGRLGGRGAGVLPEPGPAVRQRAPQPHREPRALHRVHLLDDVAAAGHPLPRAAAGAAHGHRGPGGRELRLDRLLLVHARPVRPGGLGHGPDLRGPDQPGRHRRAGREPGRGECWPGKAPASCTARKKRRSTRSSSARPTGSPGASGQPPRSR